mgnify:FL=1
MFTTFVKVCSIVATFECVEFQDNMGPYNTLKECQDRARVMALDLQRVIIPPVEFSYKCSQQLKEEFST